MGEDFAVKVNKGAVRISGCRSHRLTRGDDQEVRTNGRPSTNLAYVCHNRYADSVHLAAYLAVQLA